METHQAILQCLLVDADQYHTVLDACHEYTLMRVRGLAVYGIVACDTGLTYVGPVLTAKTRDGLCPYHIAIPYHTILQYQTILQYRIVIAIPHCYCNTIPDHIMQY